MQNSSDDNVPQRPYDYSKTQDTLVSLKEISSRLRAQSSQIGLITLAHLFFLAVSIYFIISIESHFSYSGYNRQMLVQSIFLSDVIILAGIFSFLFLFDRKSQLGHVLFQEISDEFEWGKAAERIDIEVRIALRRFALDATLPFVRSGRNGPIVYAVVNGFISVILWSLLLTRL